MILYKRMICASLYLLYCLYDRITIREAGLFVFAEVYDLGIVLQWDKGTRVKVRADPKWKDRVSNNSGSV